MSTVRIAPAGGEGARGTGLWSFADVVRLAAILPLDGTARKAAIENWPALPPGPGSAS